MKKLLLCSLLAVAAGLTPLLVQGATQHDGPAIRALVSSTGTYEDGSVYVFFDRAISTCSETNRIDVHFGYLGAKNILALAITAFTTNSYVVVHPGACEGVTAVFDATGDSYMFLNK